MLVCAAPAAAQPAPDTWQVTVAPYLMGASMNGTTTVRGIDVEANLSASEILSNLQFGAMGIVVARKGDWGVGGDIIWMALGSTFERQTGLIRPSGALDVNQGAFAFYGLRRLAPYADVTFGARVNVLQGKLRFDAPLQALGGDQSKTWADPLVGFILRTPGGRRVGLRVYSEIGGFGAGSDFEWQIFPTVYVGLGERASLDFGYRWLDMKYDDGEGDQLFGYDVLTQGPVAGFTFRF
jgi:hypothetical protein